MMSRFVRCGIVLLFLSACGASPGYSSLSIDEADFSIEYPQEWIVEDGRPLSELLAIHPPFSEEEELTPTNALYIWVIRKELFPTLRDFALSERSDFEHTRCTDPHKDLSMECEDGSRHFFIEGKTHFVSIVFNAESPYIELFSHMKESIKID